MNKKTIAAGITAIAGTVLVWIPFLFMITTSLFALAARHVFRFDYLIPAEMFPLELIGGLLLIIAAVLVKKQVTAYWKFFVWSLATALVLLAGGQIFAITSGLASGEAEPAGWIWAGVIAAIAAYSLVLISIGIAGILLIKKIFSAKQAA